MAPLCILVVDDRHDSADSLAMLLRVVGHDVHVAYNGEDCLTQARHARFDAVLLDIGMPGLDGLRVARHIRADSSCKHTLIMAITGYGDEAHRLLSEEAGFDDYLVKPVDPAHLVKRLEQLRPVRAS